MRPNPAFDVEELFFGLQGPENGAPLEYPWSLVPPAQARGAFFMHPTRLARKRKRCAPEVARLRELPRDFVSECNVCGCKQSAIIAQRDRYGLPLRTAMCRACGLIFMADRFTPEAYSEFYARGHYRRLTGAFNGSYQTIADIHADQDAYAEKLAGAIHGYVKSRCGSRVLDIGGSAGRIALKFQECFEMSALVLDPAEEEADAARKLGLEAVTSSVEDFCTGEEFDLILICRTIEHVQNLRAVLGKARSLLKPDGLLYCDIVDFTELCRARGTPEAVSKVDHCYWLSMETAPAIFRSAGLQIVSTNLALGQFLVGYLLRSAEDSEPPRMDERWMQERLRNLRDASAQWRDTALHPCDAQDWLRRKVFAIKRRLAKML